MYIETKIESAADRRAPERPDNLAAGLAPLREIAAEMQALDKALATLAGQSGEKLKGSFNRLREDLAGFEPSVTLLGQVKSGKTALTNALAGWADLLPSDVNPWTSVVTSLHLAPGSHRPETSASFRFMTEQEWDRLLYKGGRIGEMAGRAGADSELQKIHDQIAEMRTRAQKRLGQKFELLMGQSHNYGYFDKNLIERYICLGDEWADDRVDDRADGDVDPDKTQNVISGDQSEGEDKTQAQGRFADITRSADLYLNSENLPCRLCLRDTPGVNDTFMMREQITIQALRDSGLCVVVLSAAQALSSVDLGLIRMLNTMQSEQVVIFVNRIDELANPAAEIPQIEASIRDTLSQHAFEHQQEQTAPTLLFGSAYWANKVLTGETEDMAPASSAALLNWAEASARAKDAPARLTSVKSAQEMIWELSGLPALYEALAERISIYSARPLMTRIAQSALTLASGQEAAAGLEIGPGQITAAGAAQDRDKPDDAATNRQELQTRFEALAAHHINALSAELDTQLANFGERADRAHDTFVERATHSLVAHLEEWGEESVWEYDPAGLRLLLRSAYSVMGKRVQDTAKARYQAAITDAAALLHGAYGAAVEGICLAVPEPPAPPPPIALAQAIALDFNDSWWRGWWRRMRGYQAFAKTFRRLIAAETEDFMMQLKTVQTAQLRAETRARLESSLEDLRAVLRQITDQEGQSQDETAQDLRALLEGPDAAATRDVRQAALATLQQHIT